MGSETVATLVLVAVLVAVLAVYLLAIGFALRKLSFTLGTIVIGLRAIAQQTAPAGAVLGDLIGDVDVIEDALDTLVGAVVAAKKEPKRVPAPVTAAPRPSGTRPPQAVAWQPGVGEPEPVVEDGDEWDQVVAVTTAADLQPAGAVPTPGRRRSQARSSGRGSRPAVRSARGKAAMSDAVARARKKVGTRSAP